MKPALETDSVTGPVTKTSKTVDEDEYLVISNSLLGEDAVLSLDNFIFPIMFLAPLLFSLLPNFSGWKKAVKLTAQILFATWFAYTSYLIVFTFGSPLVAGWSLSIASITFVILSLIECVPMKHNE